MHVYNHAMSWPGFEKPSHGNAPRGEGHLSQLKIKSTILGVIDSVHDATSLR